MIISTEPVARRLAVLMPLAVLLAFLAGPASAQNVAVQEHVLDNGMRILLLPRKGNPNVSAGWVTRFGSVNERPGVTGIAHLFEHMMFKGTRVIGTRDIARNLEVMREMDDVWEAMRKEERALQARSRSGEIPDPPRPEDFTPRYRELKKRFEQLTAEEKKLLVKNEFDKIYTGAGASGMNAGTSNDFTIYFIQVPANKLELWFWMESDRLSNPVFREFYSERDVVREERRMRTESTPTGRFEEQFDAMYWTSSPYGWPVLGWPSDLAAITRRDALSFFDTYYAPNNLTACLVGDFDPKVAMTFAKKYFGRLRRGAHEPEPLRTREIRHVAEQRMTGRAETKPQVRIRYHTVPDGHADDFALSLLGDILSGRTGRLHKTLVLESEVANQVSAYQRSHKYEGTFELSGVAKPGKTPEDVEKAINAEIEKLKTELVGARELEKVKNQFAAMSFRRLRSSFSLMLQLLLRDAYRGWRTINTDPARIQKVTAEDIRDVVKKYFSPENRSVIVYYTKKTPGAKADPLLDGLSEEDKAQVGRLKAFASTAGPAKLRSILQQIRSQADAVPPEKKAVVEAMVKVLEQRLEAAEGAGGGKPSGKKPPEKP